MGSCDALLYYLARVRKIDGKCELLYYFKEREVSYIRGKEDNYIKKNFTFVIKTGSNHSCDVTPPGRNVFKDAMEQIVQSKTSTVNNDPFWIKLHSPALSDYLRPCLPKKKY